MLWRVKKQTTSEADDKLSQIKNILFPKLELREQSDESGVNVKYHVDYSVDSNLDAVLMDMQDGLCDETMIKTMNSMIEKLNAVRKLLDTYMELDPDAKYIIVSNGKEDESKD